MEERERKKLLIINRTLKFSDKNPAEIAADASETDIGRKREENYIDSILSSKMRRGKNSSRIHFAINLLPVVIK